jgi:hypothetical protein
MLTIKLQGGLGNQLFQLAFLLYISKISGIPYFIQNLKSPLTIHSREEYFESIFKNFKDNLKNLSVSRTLIENFGLSFEDWKSKLNSEHTEFFGYFQRHEYTDLIKEEFISKLSFNSSILEKYPDIRKKFFIHVRGGDYRKIQVHNVDLTEYYKKCLELCNGEEFVIFTNDIPYANSLLPGIQIIQESEIDSLFLMSQCKGCICANSTFSWWGAYLNSERPIYFPSIWFNKRMDTSGLYFKEVTKVEITQTSNMKKTLGNLFRRY